MRIQNPIRIEVDSQSIHPTLVFTVRLEFPRNVELPISLTGRLFVGNKVIAHLNEYQHNSDRNFNLKILDENIKRQIDQNNDLSDYPFFLETTLSKFALNHIENVREKSTDKSIEFYLELLTKSISLPNDLISFTKEDFIRLNIQQRLTSRIKIEQSRWCNEFSPKLGIGKFLLVELKVPEAEVSGVWEETFTMLKNNIDQMERAIQAGDWQQSVSVSRKFIEKIDVGKKIGAKTSLKAVLDESLEYYGHNEKGIKNLYTAINHLFHFSSKWSHENNQDGTLKPIPTTTKEDAYLVYSLSLALLGILSRSLSSSTTS